MITEEKKIYLAATFRDSPVCWKNFFHSEAEQGTQAELDRKVAQWNARLIELRTEYVLEFDTDADKLLFLLRWS
jgi:hypothetical protein